MSAPPFPADPRPSWYTQITFPDRNGFFFVDATNTPTVIPDSSGEFGTPAPALAGFSNSPSLEGLT